MPADGGVLPSGCIFSRCVWRTMRRGCNRSLLLVSGEHSIILTFATVQQWLIFIFPIGDIDVGNVRQQLFISSYMFMSAVFTPIVALSFVCSPAPSSTSASLALLSSKGWWRGTISHKIGDCRLQQVYQCRREFIRDFLLWNMFMLAPRMCTSSQHKVIAQSRIGC